jgi:hypothetical protein
METLKREVICFLVTMLIGLSLLTGVYLEEERRKTKVPYEPSLSEIVHNTYEFKLEDK